MLAEIMNPKSDDIVIVTKCGLLRNHPVTGSQYRDSRPEAIRRSAEESLRRLNTDCLDVLLIHWPDENTPIEDSMEELNRLVDEGKTRHVGVSNFKRPLLDRAEERRSDHGERDQLQHARPGARRVHDAILRGLRISESSRTVPWHTAGSSGSSTRSRSARTYGLAATLTACRSSRRSTSSRISRAVGKLKAIAERNGGTLPQLAIRWQRRQSAVSSALIGFRRPSEVDEAVKAFDWDLPESELDEADSIARAAYERMRPDQIPWPPRQPAHVPGVIGDAA